jgi:hypothetical protein
MHLAQPLDEVRAPRTLTPRSLLGVVHQMMAGPLFMGDISRSAIGSRFHID